MSHNMTTALTADLDTHAILGIGMTSIQTMLHTDLSMKKVCRLTGEKRAHGCFKMKCVKQSRSCAKQIFFSLLSYVCYVSILKRNKYYTFIFINIYKYVY